MRRKWKVRKTMGNNKKIGGKNVAYSVMIAGLLAGVGIITYYLLISTYNFPIMDFWKGRAENIEKFMNNSIEFSYFVPIPHELHSNILFTVFDWALIKYFHCNILIGIYLAVACMLALFVCLFIYFGKNLNDNTAVMAVGYVLCIIPVINLNQWEILTMYCSVAFFFRIFVYMGYFLILSRIIAQNKVNIHNSFWLALSSLLVILTMSQAYFPAFVGAVLATLILDWIMTKYREQRKGIAYLIIAAGNVLGTAIYCLTLKSTDSLSNEDFVFSEYVLAFLKGILLMLGSIIVPQTKQTDNLSNVYACGTIILVLALTAVFLFFKLKLYRISFFPIQCMIYAFVSIITIAVGRLRLFGLISLTSSRYVVETTIGLVGVGIIIFYSFSEWKNCENGKLLRCIAVASLIVFFVIDVSILGWTNKEEMNIGPYRKQYRLNMVNMAQNIDDFTDEDLGIFQAPAQDVRDTVGVMEKYHLSVWNK